MMSLTFGLFTQVSGSGPLGPLVFIIIILFFFKRRRCQISRKNVPIKRKENHPNLFFVNKELLVMVGRATGPPSS